MKKSFRIILCAALAALAVISCNKAPQEEVEIAPEQQFENLANTAVSLLKEADPNYWGEFVKSAQSLFGELATVAQGNLGFDPTGFLKAEVAEEEESYSLAEDFGRWIESVVEGDNYKLYLSSYRLSLFTGDITVKDPAPEGEEPQREFVYTRSNNPLNLVFVHDGKTYKFQFEAKDSDNDVIAIRENDYGTDKSRVEVFVPSKVAIHVTENGSTFIDAVIEPAFKDMNWDKFVNYSDEIHANATVRIPGYTLKATDVVLDICDIRGKVELFHGNTSLLALNGTIEISPLNLTAEREPINDDEYLDDPRSYRRDIPIASVISILQKIVTKVDGTLKLMGGSVVLDGVVYPQELLKTLQLEINNEEDIIPATSMVQRYLNVKVLFNNGSLVQSALVVRPVINPEGKPKAEIEIPLPGEWKAGLLFPDQTFMTFEELGQREEFDAVVGQFAIWMSHGNAIFEETEEVEPQKVDPQVLGD